MTPARFRRLALALPEAVEGSHQGHPDFRAGGRVFASLHGDGATGMVRVSPSEQARLCAEHPGAFAPANGAWGRAGCTLVRLDAVAPTVVEGALQLAWQAAITAPAARRRQTRRP